MGDERGGPPADGGGRDAGLEASAEEGGAAASTDPPRLLGGGGIFAAAGSGGGARGVRRLSTSSSGGAEVMTSSSSSRCAVVGGRDRISTTSTFGEGVVTSWRGVGSSRAVSSSDRKVPGDVGSSAHGSKIGADAAFFTAGADAAADAGAGADANAGAGAGAASVFGLVAAEGSRFSVASPLAAARAGSVASHFSSSSSTSDAYMLSSVARKPWPAVRAASAARRIHVIASRRSPRAQSVFAVEMPQTTSSWSSALGSGSLTGGSALESTAHHRPLSSDS